MGFAKDAFVRGGLSLTDAAAVITPLKGRSLHYLRQCASVLCSKYEAMPLLEFIHNPALIVNKVDQVPPTVERVRVGQSRPYEESVRQTSNFDFSECEPCVR